jgi:hypothetical protein
MKKGLFILILIVGISSLFGAVSTQSIPFSTFINGTIGPFSEWNNAGHTLTNVNVELYITSAGGEIIADNDDEFVTATISYQLGTSADLSTNASGPELAITGGSDIWLATATASSAGIDLPPGPNPSDWVTGDYSPDSPDGMQYDGSSQNATAVADIGSAYLSEYAGTGTFNFDIVTLAITNVTFSAGAGEQAAQSTDISGYVKVTYTDDGPVPVNLSAFYANYIGGVPTIYWTTQSEENNDYWNVYRGTNEDFETANQINSNPVPGNGTTNYASDYIFVDPVPVQQNTTYWYWIEDVSTDGETTIHEPITLSIPFEDTPAELDIYGLEQNYPNPFNPSTSISFSLEEYSEVELTIYNMNGQKIKDLEVVRTGLNGTALWDGNDENGKQVSSGVYLYKLTTDNKVYQKKMLLVK